MKNKLKGVLGIALTIVMVLSLTVALAPAAPASADPGELKWTKIPLPKVGEDGDFVLTPGTDVGPIAITPDGDAMFAGLQDDSEDWQLMKSIDDGETWKLMEGFRDEADDNGDSSMIMDILASPEYEDDATVFVATMNLVYQSVDGGKTFSPVDETPPWAGEIITDLDVTLDEKGRLSLMVGTRGDEVGLDLKSSGEGEAECSTAQANGGSYSVHFIYPGKVTITLATPVKFGDIDELSFYEYVDDLTAGNFRAYFKLYLDNGSKIILETCAAAGDEAWYDDWVERDVFDPGCPDGFHGWDIPDTGEPYQGLEAWQAIYGDANVTKIQIGASGGLYEGYDGYIDDITINGVTYDLEFDVAYTSLGDVYVYCPATTGMSWQDQDVTCVAGSGDYHVLAVAFSPNFADEEGISAVVNDYTKGMTRVAFSFGNTADGGGWGEDVGDARIRDAYDKDFASCMACIGYPDDFDVDSLDSNICFVGIYGGDTGYTDDTGPTGIPEKGDVYKVVLKPATYSTATDLDMRGVVTTLNPTATNIVDIAVCGDAEDANIIASTSYVSTATTPYYWMVYRSDDGGETWSGSGPWSPTGGYQDSWTHVLMSPDFLTDGVAYASTTGDDTSALSRSTDEGASWNQISLIDYADPSETGYTVVHMSASPAYAKDETLFMVTQVGFVSDSVVYGLIGGTKGAIWKTTNDGSNWERIWSYANPGVTPTLNKVYLSSDDTVFAVDRSAGKLWRSSDGGATWPRKITAEEPKISAEKIISPTTIYTGYADGSFYYTTKTGRPWEKPEDSEITGAIKAIGVKGDTVLVGSNTGKVYISSDACETFERVGLTNPGDTAGVPATPHGLAVLPSFDGGYATNGIIYAAVIAEDGGIWRTEVDEDDPDSAEWERIDEESPGYDTVIPMAAAIMPGNILYSADLADVDKPDVGGMWRSVNPNEEDVDDVLFIKANKGLSDNTVALLGTFSVFPTTMFCINLTAVAGGDLDVGDSMELFAPVGAWTIATTVSDYYYNQIVAFTDTLCAPVELVKPADGATGAGVILAEAEYAPAVTAVWKAMEDADMYEYQLAVDEEFESKIGDLCGFTEGQIKKFKPLTPGATYYWRVRVADEDDDVLTGAPLISPWSEVWKFTTALGAGPARPDLVSPFGGQATGGVDTPLSPAFQWTQVFGATGYHLQLGTDPTFATTIADKKLGTETSWGYDAKLDFSTTYFWRVKAIGPSESPWSDVGSFVTEAAPPPPEPLPPAPPPPEPPPPTPMYIWTIIGIGALLVIAVIVLIVRTRRVV